MLSLLKISLILHLFSVSLFCSSPNSIKAVQISYLDSNNLNDFERELKRIKVRGYDTVIFRVFNNKNDRIYPFIKDKDIKNRVGVYFKTEYYPVVNNILPQIVNLSHKNNLKIIAWITTRNLDYGVSEDKKIVKYDFTSNKFKTTDGLTLFSYQNCIFLSKILKDLLKNRIDGVLLQDDLKIFIEEDFNKSAIKRFYAQTGISITEANVKKLLYNDAADKKSVKDSFMLRQWTDFKASQLNKFLKSLLKMVKSDRKIFMNINYESLYKPQLSTRWFSYNLQTIKDTGVDYFMVMLYQKQISKELRLVDSQANILVEQLILDSYKMIDKDKVVFKIQVFDWGSNKPLEEKSLNKLFTFFENNNIANIAIFPYKKNLTIFK